MDEEEAASRLEHLILKFGVVRRVTSFEDAGISTRCAGFVVEFDGGEKFEVTVARAR